MTGLALGPFELSGPAGAGAMAEVWRGVHRRQGTPVAIKVMTTSRTRGERYRALFGREVRAVARMDHPGIVRVFDHGVVPAALAQRTRQRLPEGAPWLAMDWLDGGALRARRGHMRWPQLRETLLALLDALAHAHARGLVHRDLKDANVLIGPAGPVITDFGLAIERHDPAVLQAKRTVGTPYFMAPETVRGRGWALGPWTDLYALGCMAFALASGAPPFAGQGPLDVMRAQSEAARPSLVSRHPMPAGFEGWIRRLMTIDHRSRFRFAADAAAALGALGAGEGTVAGSAELPTDPRPVPPDWRRGPTPQRPPPLLDVGRSLVTLREPRLRGRLSERDRLWAALTRVATGGGAAAVVIDGPPGAGKTRLARWLQSRAHESGVADALTAVHAPTPEPDAGPVPMLARALTCRGLTGRERAARVAHVLELPASDPRAGRIAAALGSLDGEDARVDTGGEAARVAGWCLALELASRSRPLVVLIDDAQWADEGLALVLAALERPAIRALFVLTCRNDILPMSAAWAEIEARAGRLTLGALEADAMRRMIDDRLPLDGRTAALVQRRAAGSPLFAAELLRHWVDAGALVPGRAGFGVRQTARDALPEGLGDLGWARLTRAVEDAEPWALEALEGAAVLGAGIDPDEWAALCDAADLEVPRAAVAGLVDGRVVVEGPANGWRFAHGMLREALLQRARTAGRLRRWHHLAADVLADRPGPARDQRRAHHLQRAGLPDRARPLYTRLAWRAWAISEDRRARRAVIDAARAAWREGLPDAHAARAELRALWALCARGAGHGTRHAKRAMAAVLHVDPLTAARVRFAWAYAATGGSDPAAAAARFADAVQAAEQAAEQAARRLAAPSAGGEPMDEDPIGDAIRLAMRGQRWRASLLTRVGALDQATRCLDDAESLAPDGLDPAERGYIAARRAEIAAARGEGAAAEGWAMRAHAAFSAIEHRAGLGMIARQLSEIARRRGALDVAERWLGTARAIWLDLGRVQAVRLTDLNRGLLLSEQRRFAEARTCLEGVRGPGCPTHYAVLACLLLLPGDAAVGDWARWRTHWAAIEPLRAGRFVEADVALAARLAARIAAEAGARQMADAAWILARDQFIRLGRLDDARAVEAEQAVRAER